MGIGDRDCSWFACYGVEIRPLLVATIQRLPQRTIESTFPNPGTVSPLVALNIPSGPSKTAVPPTTSRTIQPSIVLGRVSGTAVGLGKSALCWIAASRGFGRVVFRWSAGVAVFVDAETCGAAPRDGWCATAVAVGAGILWPVGAPGVVSRSDLRATQSASPEASLCDEQSGLCCVRALGAGEKTSERDPLINASPAATKSVAMRSAGTSRWAPDATSRLKILTSSADTAI
jgi:hypothetical protein